MSSTLIWFRDQTFQEDFPEHHHAHLSWQPVTRKCQVGENHDYSMKTAKVKFLLRSDNVIKTKINREKNGKSITSLNNVNT